MWTIYHQAITKDALSGKFSLRALKIILAANQGQDRFVGQIGHPQFHFDDCAFDRDYAYMREQREIVLTSIKARRPMLGWQAFGRITHAGQDFYAHSNYLDLWLEKHNIQNIQSNLEVDPIDEEINRSSRLVSGRNFLSGLLVKLPWIGKPIKNMIPHDSHTWMNKDGPFVGPIFDLVLQCARKRMLIEYDIIIKSFNGTDLNEIACFTDLDEHLPEGNQGV
jgi:hypothetical protein